MGERTRGMKVRGRLVKQLCVPIGRQRKGTQAREGVGSSGAAHRRGRLREGPAKIAPLPVQVQARPAVRGVDASAPLELRAGGPVRNRGADDVEHPRAVAGREVYGQRPGVQAGRIELALRAKPVAITVEQQRTVHGTEGIAGSPALELESTQLRLAPPVPLAAQCQRLAVKIRVEGRE